MKDRLLLDRLPTLIGLPHHDPETARRELMRLEDAGALSHEQAEQFFKIAHPRSPSNGDGGARTPFGGREVETPLYRSLEQILADPEALRPPKGILPELAWRGRLSLFAAREKTGKSTITSAGIAAVTRGGRFLGAQCTQETVLWLHEEHVNDLAARAKRFQTDAARLYLMPLPLRRGALDLQRAITDLSPSIVVIDTLVRYADGITESGSSAQWQPIMTDLLHLARTHNAAILILHHGRKSDGRVRDSTEISAAADVIIEMPEGLKGKSQTLEVRGRLGTSKRFTIELHGDEFCRQPLLEDEVISYVYAHPGCSARTIEEEIKGKRSRIREVLSESQLVVNKGTKTRQAWYPTIWLEEDEDV